MGNLFSSQQRRGKSEPSEASETTTLWADDDAERQDTTVDEDAGEQLPASTGIPTTVPQPASDEESVVSSVNEDALEEQQVPAQNQHGSVKHVAPDTSPPPSVDEGRRRRDSVVGEDLGVDVPASSTPRQFTKVTVEEIARLVARFRIVDALVNGDGTYEDTANEAAEDSHPDPPSHREESDQTAKKSKRPCPSHGRVREQNPHVFRFNSPPPKTAAADVGQYIAPVDRPDLRPDLRPGKGTKWIANQAFPTPPRPSRRTEPRPRPQSPRSPPKQARRGNYSLEALAYRVAAHAEWIKWFWMRELASRSKGRAVTVEEVTDEESEAPADTDADAEAVAGAEPISPTSTSVFDPSERTNGTAPARWKGKGNVVATPPKSKGKQKAATPPAAPTNANPAPQPTPQPTPAPSDPKYHVHCRARGEAHKAKTQLQNFRDIRDRKGIYASTSNVNTTLTVHEILSQLYGQGANSETPPAAGDSNFIGPLPEARPPLSATKKRRNRKEKEQKKKDAGSNLDRDGRGPLPLKPCYKASPPSSPENTEAWLDKGFRYVDALIQEMEEHERVTGGAGKGCGDVSCGCSRRGQGGDGGKDRT